MSENVNEAQNAEAVCGSGSSHGSADLPPGLYWAREYSPFTPGGERREYSKPRIVEVSGKPPWLRMKRVYPFPTDKDPIVGNIEIIKPCCLDE
jgi:hypothetical protein